MRRSVVLEAGTERCGRERGATSQSKIDRLYSQFIRETSSVMKRRGNGSLCRGPQAQALHAGGWRRSYWSAQRAAVAFLWLCAIGPLGSLAGLLPRGRLGGVGHYLAWGTVIAVALSAGWVFERNSFSIEHAGCVWTRYWWWCVPLWRARMPVSAIVAHDPDGSWDGDRDRVWVTWPGQRQCVVCGPHAGKVAGELSEALLHAQGLSAHCT